MIRIRVNRDDGNKFVELHIDSAQSSITFTGCHYVDITKNLDALIATLQEVQDFMAHVPESNTRKWEV